MLRARRTIAGSMVASAMLALGACGATSRSNRTQPRKPPGTRTIDIYSSLPLRGSAAPAGEAIANGIKLALSQSRGRAGDFKVHYISLDDATAAASGQGYAPAATAADARRAAADNRTVYYIGDFDSAASAISIPILNEAGVAQVSPASTYVGLTTSEPGSAKGEPTIFYPAGTRTFLRIVPRDSVGAAADLEAMRQGGCTRLAEVNDTTEDGAETAQLVGLAGPDYGIHVVGDQTLRPGQPDPVSFAARLRAEGANCFFLVGMADAASVELTRDVLAALPRARIFGSDGMCTSAWTDARDGGVPASADPQLECTSDMLPLSAYPGGRTFLAAYRARYRVSDPSPYAIYGYEAMKLGLSTIARLGPKGDEKSAVVGALFATRNRNSVLGTYSFDSAGDTTLNVWGLYRVGPDGRPVFARSLTPSKVL